MPYLYVCSLLDLLFGDLVSEINSRFDIFVVVDARVSLQECLHFVAKSRKFFISLFS